MLMGGERDPCPKEIKHVDCGLGGQPCRREDRDRSVLEQQACMDDTLANLVAEGCSKCRPVPALKPDVKARTRKRLEEMQRDRPGSLAVLRKNRRNSTSTSTSTGTSNGSRSRKRVRLWSDQGTALSALSPSSPLSSHTYSVTTAAALDFAATHNSWKGVESGHIECRANDTTPVDSIGSDSSSYKDESGTANSYSSFQGKGKGCTWDGLRADKGSQGKRKWTVPSHQPSEGGAEEGGSKGSETESDEGRSTYGVPTGYVLTGQGTTKGMSGTPFHLEDQYQERHRNGTSPSPSSADPSYHGAPPHHDCPTVSPPDYPGKMEASSLCRSPKSGLKSELGLGLGKDDGSCPGTLVEGKKVPPGSVATKAVIDGCTQCINPNPNPDDLANQLGGAGVEVEVDPLPFREVRELSSSARSSRATSSSPRSDDTGMGMRTRGRTPEARTSSNTKCSATKAGPGLGIGCDGFNPCGGEDETDTCASSELCYQGQDRNYFHDYEEAHGAFAQQMTLPTPLLTTAEAPLEIGSSDEDGNDDDDKKQTMACEQVVGNVPCWQVNEQRVKGRGRGGSRASEKGPSSFQDSSFVSTPLGDGLRGVISKNSLDGDGRDSTDNIIYTVHLGYATAYMPLSSLSKVPHQTRLVYPNNKTPGAVRVTRADMLRLQEKVYLNDTIIDFYLRYLLLQPEGVGGGLTHDQVHIFSPLFFETISNMSGQQTKESWERIQKWTKGMNVFSKKVVMFPINQSLHWSLAILCNPNRLRSRSEESIVAKPKTSKTKNRTHARTSQNLNPTLGPLVEEGGDRVRVRFGDGSAPSLKAPMPSAQAVSEEEDGVEVVAQAANESGLGLGSTRSLKLPHHGRCETGKEDLRKGSLTLTLTLTQGETIPHPIHKQDPNPSGGHQENTLPQRGRGASEPTGRTLNLTQDMGLAPSRPSPPGSSGFMSQSEKHLPIATCSLQRLDGGATVPIKQALLKTKKQPTSTSEKRPTAGLGLGLGSPKRENSPGTKKKELSEGSATLTLAASKMVSMPNGHTGGESEALRSRVDVGVRGGGDDRAAGASSTENKLGFGQTSRDPDLHHVPGGDVGGPSTCKEGVSDVGGSVGAGTEEASGSMSTTSAVLTVGVEGVDGECDEGEVAEEAVAISKHRQDSTVATGNGCLENVGDAGGGHLGGNDVGTGGSLACVRSGRKGKGRNPRLAELENSVQLVLPTPSSLRASGSSSGAGGGQEMTEKTEVGGVETKVDWDEETPCILLLDSMKGNRAQGLYKTIRSYVEAAWDNTQMPSRGEADFSAVKLPSLRPAVPQQNNDCDCGVYLLHYASLFLKNPPSITEGFIANKGKGSILCPTWFDHKAISDKRKALRNLIETLRWSAIQEERALKRQST